jgi:selenocysteine lyase/cysteine desulfurase
MSMPVHSFSNFADGASVVRQQEIGRRTSIQTPFGRRLIYYADLAATGRHLEFVENWIRRTRPFYANTHAEISSTGRLMTELREAARRVIRRAVYAADQDEVLFVGSGAC